MNCREKTFDWKRDGPILALILVLPLLSFAALLWPERTLYRHDLTSIHYPLLVYKARLLRLGQIAFWNPHLLFGFPQLAGQDVLALHPLNLLLLLPLKPNFALTLFVVLQYSLAGVFAFWLARSLRITRTGSLITGVTYALGGYLMAQPTNLPILTGAVWLPLVLLLFVKTLETRRPLYAILCGVAIAVQVLTSHPQPVFLTLCALGAYGVFWLVRTGIDKQIAAWARTRRLMLLSSLMALAVVVGFALAFTQIAATWQLKGMSSRAGGLNLYFMTTYSLPPHNLLVYLFSNILGNPVIGYAGEDTFGELHAYVGIVPLMLCLWAWAPRKRDSHVAFFTLLAAGALLLALGGYTPLYNLLAYVPGFNWFRAPARWSLVVSLSLSVLAGFGFDVLIVARREPKASGASPAWWSAWGAMWWANLALSLLLVGVLVLEQRVTGWLDRLGGGTASDEGLRQAVVLAQGLTRLPLMEISGDLSATVSSLNPALFYVVVSNVGFLLIHLWSRRRISAAAFQVTLLALVIFDLVLTGGTTINPVRDAAYFDRQPQSTAFLQDYAGLYRVFPPVYGDDVENLVDNIPIIYGLYSVRGHMSELVMERYKSFMEVLPDSPALLNLAGVKYVLLEETPLFPWFARLPVGSGPEIHENTAVLPRAFVVHSAEVIPGGDAALERMLREDFDPSRTVVLEQEPAEGAYRVTIPDQPDLRGARIELYSPHRVVIEADLNANGFLVLSDTYYPGWRAYVDGREVPIYQADYLFRAVFLEQGQHRVEFRYSPRFLRVALVLALVTVAILVGLGAGAFLGRGQGKRT